MISYLRHRREKKSLFGQKPEAAPQSQSAEEQSRRFSLVNISERKDLNNLQSNREPFTSDMDLYDVYIGQMKNGMNRLEGDAPFNETVWTHVREALDHAQPCGFDELKQEGSCQLKTTKDAGAVFVKCDNFRHLMPIFPNLLAEKIGVPLQDVLTELFYATMVGLVDMVWSPDCERCGGSVCQAKTLGDIPGEASCRGCGFENKIEYLDTVKVYFVLNSEVFYMPVTNFECPHSPAKMAKLVFLGIAFPSVTKSGFSYIFGTEDEESEPALKKGTYRVICPYSQVDCFLNVEAEVTPEDTPIKKNLRVSDITRSPVGVKRKEMTIPHGRVQFDMLCDTNSIFVPFVYKDMMDDEAAYRLGADERKPFTSASQCVHHPSFKKLFEKQIVSEGSFFTIKRVVLVFTDVVGSTAMYESAGDGKALDSVRQHFKVLFTAFASSGRVVKTVGDCVMAAFTSGEAAIKAVAKGLEKLELKCQLPCGKTMAIRVGMHRGPTLMVALNGINDYFGQTVNVAARVESKAESRECLVTEAVLSEPGAMAAFEKVVSKGLFKHSRDVDLSLKGVDHLVRAKGFQLRGAQGC